MYPSRRFPSSTPRRRQYVRCSPVSILILIFFFVFNVLLWWLPTSHEKLQSSNTINGQHGIPHKSEEVHIDHKENFEDATMAKEQVGLGSTPLSSTTASLPPSSSLLRVTYSGRTSLTTLKSLMDRIGYEPKKTSTVCPPLPSDAPTSLDDPFEIGMSREFLGGMYHPVHCMYRERYSQNGKVDKKANTMNCEKEAFQALEDSKHRSPRYAFVMMVSNHRYLDGAMVLADSIREHSTLSHNRSAEIVLIISEFIKEEMFPLLQVTFDRVKIFRGLQTLAPKSAYKGTFDKIYLYMLEDYPGGVLFMDADTLMHANPDAIVQIPEVLSDVVNGNHTKDNSPGQHRHYGSLRAVDWKRWVSEKTVPHIFAIGDESYFQTGLLIIRPSLKIFLDLYLEFRMGSFGYNQWRARDGLLFRNCFQSIGGLSSRPEGLHHFTGSPKPWFNQAKLDHSLETMNVRLKNVISQSWRDFKSHFDWWQRYESLHMTSFRQIEKETRRLYGLEQNVELLKWRKKLGGKRIKNIPGGVHITKYGGAQLIREVTEAFPLPIGFKSVYELEMASPDEYMWMSRFTRNTEYLHPTRAVAAKIHTGTSQLSTDEDLQNLLSVDKRITGSIVYSLAVPKGDGSWESCDKVCQDLHLKCEKSALRDTRIADCEHGQPVGTMANGAIRCKSCLPHFKEGAPFLLYRKGAMMKGPFLREADVCFFNAWTRFAIPMCNMSRPPPLKSYELKAGDLLTPLCACV